MVVRSHCWFAYEVHQHPCIGRRVRSESNSAFPGSTELIYDTVDCFGAEHVRTFLARYFVDVTRILRVEALASLVLLLTGGVIGLEDSTGGVSAKVGRLTVC